MRVAIPLSGRWVAPVLDTADSMLIVDLVRGQHPESMETIVRSSSMRDRAKELASFGVDVVLCHQASHALERLILAQGMEIVPNVTGNVDGVLDAYRDHNRTQPSPAPQTLAMGAEA